MASTGEKMAATVDLRALVQRQQAQMERQQEELESLTAELRSLREAFAGAGRRGTAEAGAQESDTPDQSDVHTNFVATGPVNGRISVGVLARPETNEGFDRGVVGIASKDNYPDISKTIGVYGMTTTLDGAPADGTGVRGVTARGIGVSGRALGNGTGVSGRAYEDGTGVEGTSDAGIGVSARSNSIGVFGSGGAIGVEGASDSVGVLGGAPLGRVFTQMGSFYVGVVGNGPSDPEGTPFSYGAWFDAINGTAPVHLEPAQQDTPPASGQRGDLFVGSDGGLWFCTDGGDQATWRRVQLA